MKHIIYITLIGFCLLLSSCQGILDGVNDNPNRVPTEDLSPKLFLTGAQLANVSFQNGHLSRISSLYSGQLFGFASVYSDIYRYNISTAESNSSWDKIYVGVRTNTQSIINNTANDLLLRGIAKVVEANAIGSAASIFGDVPYSEANNTDIPDPIFDNQIAVLGSVQVLLNEAISDLQAGASRPLDEDIHFGGDKDKWIAAANSLKARFFMLTREYSMAYSSAQAGIMDHANSWVFTPQGTSTSVDDKNQFFTMLNGARGGDIGSGQSYLTQLMDPSNALYRGNAKSDETARSAYSYVQEADGDSNTGIIDRFEPQALATYVENQLILAEAGARQSFATGLGHLNEYRTFLDSGGYLNANFSGMAYNYEAYDATDFDPGGIENADNIDATRALLREIVEERYVSGFLSWMPFEDHRRLRKDDMDLVVPFSTNDASAPNHVGRLPYASDELNANSNGPSADPGIFTQTAVNQ